ncbi:hypothetical protein BH11VER1_BH11VER1_19690 [soil metagenome]
MACRHEFTEEFNPSRYINLDPLVLKEAYAYRCSPLNDEAKDFAAT